jgi:hypothetical protein
MGIQENVQIVKDAFAAIDRGAIPMSSGSGTLKRHRISKSNGPVPLNPLSFLDVWPWHYLHCLKEP